MQDNFPIKSAKETVLFPSNNTTSSDLIWCPPEPLTIKYLGLKLGGKIIHLRHTKILMVSEMCYLNPELWRDDFIIKCSVAKDKNRTKTIRYRLYMQLLNA